MLVTMATDARKNMVRTTDKLLRRQGYHGTGLNQIVAESGAPKGSMYFHFPGGKAELAATAVTEFGEWKARLLREAIEANGSAAEGVAYYLEQAARGFEKVGYADGCTVATVSAEVAPNEPRLATATRDALRNWIDLLAARLEVEGFTADEAARRAMAAVTLIEGAVVVARGMQSADPVRQAAATARGLLTPRT
jgi:TetR/AcrR family transcriptional repressor of lmrAB and yxaGH operons